MKQTTLCNGEESLVDIATREYQSVEALFEIALRNGYGIDDVPLVHATIELPIVNVAQVQTIAQRLKVLPLQYARANGEESLSDLVVNRYANIEALFVVAFTNKLGLDDLPLLHSSIRLPEVKMAARQTIAFPFAERHKDKAIAAGDQVVVDMAMQEGGSIEAMFDFAYLNGVKLSDDLEVGRSYRKPRLLNRPIAALFDDIRKPASGYNLATIITTLNPDGIDYWIIEDTFLVQ